MKFINVAFPQITFARLCLICSLALMTQSCSVLPDLAGSSKNEPSTDAVTDSDKVADIEKRSEKASAKGEKRDIKSKSPEPLAPFSVKPTPLKNELLTATKSRYQAGLKHMKAKQWQKALVIFDEVLALHPDLSSAHLNKALAQLKLTDYEAALSAVALAENVNALNPYLYNLRGIIAREQGEFSVAETAYLQAISIWPHYPQAHLNLAVMYEIYRGKFTQAKKHYQKYLSLKPNDKKAKQWLAGLEIKLASAKRS